MSLPLPMFEFAILTFQAGPHIGRQCNVVKLKPSAIKKSNRNILINK